MTVFLTWAFAATGAPASGKRTLPNRLADVVNVKDFGAIGNGVNDDTAEIQAAIDAAFGTAGSPNGTNSTLNRPLIIPSGNYLISSPLILTDVVGGQIIGGGMESTRIAGSTSIFTVNGCENTSISGFVTESGGKSTSNGRHGMQLNAGAGAIGLSDVTLSDIAFNSTQYGLRIASGGVGGVGIFLLQCVMSQTDVGVRLEGADCQVTVTGGVCYSTNTGFWIEEGNLNHNMQMANGTAALDILHESTGVTTVYGTRSESPSFLKATNGTIIGVGVLHQGTATAGSAVNAVSPGVVKLIGARLGGGGNTGWITGDGDVFLRNVSFQHGEPIYMQSFTGRICECVTSDIFTFAELPPAAEGLALNISNSNTAGWGLTVASSGANAVMTRYNGTNWTVVGK
jgi:hypothetical protein